jgi:hypothetical protein
MQPSNYPISIGNTLAPVPTLLSVTPSLAPIVSSSAPSPTNDINNSSILNTSPNHGTNILNTEATIALYLGSLFAITMLLLVNFRYMYKFVMDKLGYELVKPMNFDTSVSLRIASLEKCIQHFWEYRGVIYKKGSITDELFSRSNDAILNTLNEVSMNPSLLCPVSYYKVICHMTDRKSEAIRNKSYETLLACKSVMTKCVTVECIQLLKRMFIDCGRPKVKEHAVTILCEISRCNSNLITFDIYDMFRSYKMHASDMSLSHAIETTLHDIRQNCVHLHAQIDIDMDWKKRITLPNNLRE